MNAELKSYEAQVAANPNVFDTTSTTVKKLMKAGLKKANVRYNELDKEQRNVMASLIKRKLCNKRSGELSSRDNRGRRRRLDRSCIKKSSSGNSGKRRRRSR